jgi:uncharacterized protein (TIGR00288 family)
MNARRRCAAETKVDARQMTAQFARTPYRGRSGGSTAQEPHAALLIDFDNVTMGIRSDLTKELKNLLNSDIIKGKVAVQRAYADWRRYPQYIVPLAESSVDLIFAPAYGSAKKNATDIRLAIDAVELVFTRPEIGTIILLSGDSDFSSLVLKLKEYGKYVIGVGIRESASDLLVQNCDEYYSYSALTGLTRAGEEGPAVSEDPWELVEVGLRQMIENDDVMRSDRLKQVLLEMDPSFDEKALGFQKFNKFLQDAANRGIISLRKQENGQYEVGPPTDEAVEAGMEPAREAREGRSRRGRRGRGRRDEREPRDRGPARDQLEFADGEDEDAAGTAAPEPAVAAAGAAPEPAAEAPAEAPAEAAAPVEAAAAEPVVEETAAADASEAPIERAARAPRRGRGGRTTPSVAAASEDGTAAPVESSAAETTGAGRSDGLAAGYDLLRRAVSELVKKSGPAVRDSDVKRRMLEMQPGWDEATLGFSKFSRFLRTAHEAEVITLRKGDNGVFDVLQGDGGVHVEPDREERGGRRDRGRGGRGREQRDAGYDDGTAAGEGRAAPAAAAAGATQATTVAASAATVSSADMSAQTATSEAPRETQATPPAAARPAQKLPEAAPAAAMGFRRGSRGRPAPGGPPPLLEGQAAPIVKPDSVAATPATQQAPPRVESAPAAVPQGTGPAPAEELSAEARDVAEKSAAGKGEQPRGKHAPAERSAGPVERPAAGQPAKQPVKQPGKQSDKQLPQQTGKQPQQQTGKQPQQQTGKQAPQQTGKQPAKQAGKQPAKQAGKPARPGVPAAISAVALGLPSEPAAMVDYMATNYKGVGPKSVQTLIDTFGAGKLYDTLEKQHDRIIEVMGTSRGENLIDAFADDLAARRANAAPDSRSVVAKQAATGGRPAKKRGGPPAGGAGARRGPPRGRPAGK